MAEIVYNDLFITLYSKGVLLTEIKVTLPKAFVNVDEEITAKVSDKGIGED
jgi:hypothetical protein